MSIHRYTVVLGITISLFGLGTGRAHAQARVDSGEATEPLSDSETLPKAPLGEADDPAATALRSLYVPGGLTSTEAVTQIVEVSPDLDRVRALLLEAKGGAMQAMSGVVPRLDMIGRYSRLSPVNNPTFD
ncbi:MAG: hypothetical protein WCE62_06190, partial [Polyangiales bacterium]